jgi:hypothetical protein
MSFDLKFYVYFTVVNSLGVDGEKLNCVTQKKIFVMVTGVALTQLHFAQGDTH